MPSDASSAWQQYGSGTQQQRGSGTPLRTGREIFSGGCRFSCSPIVNKGERLGEAEPRS
jgi:hypothetical protein